MSNLALVDLEEQFFASAWRKFQSVIGELASRSEDLQSCEEWLLGELVEVGRLLVQQWVNDHGLGEVGGACIETESGEKLSHRRVSERELKTVFGTVRIRRMGYGRRGHASVYPLEKECEIPERHYSYALQRRACREAVLHAYDDAVDSVETYMGVRVPKRQLLSLVHDASQQVDSFYEQHEPAACPAEHVVVLTMDGKGMVMRSEDLRPETRRKQASLEYKQRNRLSKGEKPYRKRIATVAAVYHLEPQARTADDVLAEFRHQEPKQRPRAQDKRVWANVKDEVRVVADQVVEEAERRVGNHSHVVFISDGDHRMRKPMQAALADSLCPDLHPDKVTFIVDFIHALERLWSAAFALFGEGSPEVEPWVDRQLKALLQGKAVRVAATMRSAATRRKLSGNRRKKLDLAANYLSKYKDHMRYDEYLRLGFPIASGVIEGACKHVVKDRCERSGARWSLQGADSLLKLRSVWLSGDWDAFWPFYTRQDQAQRWAPLRWESISKRPTLRVINGGKTSC